MNLKKNRLFKFMALLMAFVWLFGAYATSMTGVHATDDINNPGEDDNYYIGGENLGENDEEGLGIEATIGVLPMVNQSPPVGTWPYPNRSTNLQRRDHPSSFPDSDPIRYSFNTSYLTQGMTLGAIFDLFFNCPLRRTSDLSSGHPSFAGERFPYCPIDRRYAFRVFHAHGTDFPYMNMQRDDYVTPFPSARWDRGRLHGGYFQYAYVQLLQFNMNFCGDGDPGDIRDRYERMVIMGSYYDRMFVGPGPAVYGTVDGYFTLRNYLFPTSPNCPTAPRCPILSVDRPGTVPHSTQRDVAHPEGFIFGGWFHTPGQASNTASQDGRAWERGMGNVTTTLDRQIYARWHRPAVEKIVNPTEITPAQIAAGTPVEYTITITTDNMPAYLINFNVVDNLDPRLTFLPGSVNITPAPGEGLDSSFTLADGVLTFDISGSGEEIISEIVITFQVTVSPDATGTIGNTAYLYGPPGTGEGPIDQDEDEFEILPDGSITVNVVYDDGALVPGAIVNLYDGEGNLIGTAVTGENGRVVFPNLPDGEYTVRVTHPNYPDWSRVVPVEIVDASDEIVTVVIPRPGVGGPPDPCDCECDCECDCPECDCECDCVEGQQQPGNVPPPAGKAPTTGDFTATAPLLAGLLFSMSAVLGGTSLRKRFRR